MHRSHLVYLTLSILTSPILSHLISLQEKNISNVGKSKLKPFKVCSPNGYLAHQGYDIHPVLSLIPSLRTLLHTARSSGLQIYHTREGHRPDLTTLSTRELFRSRNNPSGLGIGDRGPLGRLLIRGERGHDTVDELYPLPNEPVIEKPGKGCFAYTDFDLLLRVRGESNFSLFLLFQASACRCDKGST